MIRKFFVFLLLSALLLSPLTSALCAETGKIKGIVKDEQSGEALPGVTITVDGTDIVTFTDEKGSFEIDISEGTYTVIAEFLGYSPSKAENVVASSEKDNIVNFSLKEFAAIEGEEVIVTGDRMNIPISRATASVEVVNSKKFEVTAGADNAGDILKNTPGVQMESVGGPGTRKIIKIRGQGSQVNSNRVLLLIDGIPAQSPRVGTGELSDFPVEMIERIEVMKGAASAIYGGSAQAGVINIITKKGRKKPVFKFNTKVSTYQHRTNANQDWSQYYGIFHSWGGENWNYTISGSYLFSKGLTYAEKGNIAVFPAKGNFISVNHPGFPGFNPKEKATAPPFFNQDMNVLQDTGDLDDSENYNVNASFGAKLFKGNRFNLSVGYSFRKNPQSFGVLTVPTIQLQSGGKRDYINFSDNWEITPDLSYSFKLNLAKITENADLVFFSSDYVSKRNAGYYKRNNIDPWTDVDFYKGTGIPGNVAPFHYFAKNWNMDNSITFTSDILEPDGNGLTIGESFRWEKVDLPPSKNGGNLIFTETPQHRKFTSLYFQDVQKFGKLNVNIGGRWEQITGFIDDWDDEFSPRVAINYEIKPGTSIRASVGRAFRPPEYSHIYWFKGQGGNLYGNPNLGYEITWSYELGFKFLTKYLSGDIAYFYSKYSDQEVSVPLLAVNPNFINLNNPKNVKFFKIYKQNREILGEGIAKSVEEVIDYYISNGFINKEELINEAQRSVTWINRGTSVHQGFDVSFDISNPWLPEFAIGINYLFDRAVAEGRNPFDFSQGDAPSPVLGINSLGGKKSPIPLSLLELNGNRLVEVPTHNFRVRTSYRFPFGLMATINGRFKSTSRFKSNYSASGAIPQPEHWIWDLALVQPLFNGKMKVKFAIENIFSKLYYEVGMIPSSVARYELGLSWEF